MIKDVIEIFKDSIIEISNLIRFKNTLYLGNTTTETNSSSDSVKTLDLLSNQIISDKLNKCKYVREYSSEEEETIIKTPFTDGEYFVSFDPLDGSSNIDSNVTVGTIFCIFKFNEDKISGKDIVTAGYSLYGGSTQIVIADENKIVSLFQLDITNKFLFISDLTIPDKDDFPYYSINESSYYDWNSIHLREYINTKKREGKSQRWIASMVADVHRTILKGGVFIYPGNSKSKEGKIRLVYEAWPMAYIMVSCGGDANNGNELILDLPFPENLHKRTPIYLGNKEEMKKILELS